MVLNSAVAIITSVALISLIWTIPLKGFSLWFSARNGQKVWFIVLLVVNTLGLLEIVYLIFFSGLRGGPKKSKRQKSAKKRPSKRR